MGGEKYPQPSRLALAVGSPPRGRGKAACRRRSIRYNRITPAWAGKSHTGRFPARSAWDHPRVGGEKFEDVRNIVGQIGSSPRRRGKGVVNGRAGLLVGITPTWAGKSGAALRCGFLHWDHPRMGGEKCRLLAVVACPAGSPPRGRGKAGHGSDIAQRHGITPA